MRSYTSNSTEQTEMIGAEFAKTLPQDAFVALYGDLGAGKTAFVRGVASIVCPEARVFSPTYTVVNEYTTDTASLYHFDLYRITGEDDLYSTGFYDYISQGICVCEWCENIPYAIPDDALCVKIEKITDDGMITDKRQISVYDSPQEMMEYENTRS